MHDNRPFQKGVGFHLGKNDLIRMTLDRYLAGAKGYGQAGYGPDASGADVIGWKTPWTSLDSMPSFLISACNYVNGSGDLKWARANYDKLAAWGREMFAADKNGNGLIEYPGTGNFGDRPKTDRRPANWWDTINFGHEDAFANALAYRGATMFAELARKLNHAEDARFFSEKAAKLRAAYAPTLLNPVTGVIAGWKSADGQLHDYWFTYVQGMAVTFGLLDDPTANRVMDRLLAKMQAVGYTNFSIGLPGNLVPVKKGDYVHENHKPEATGEQQPAEHRTGIAEVHVRQGAHAQRAHGGHRQQRRLHAVTTDVEQVQREVVVIQPVVAKGVAAQVLVGHLAARSRDVVPIAECPVHSAHGNRVAFALRDALQATDTFTRAVAASIFTKPS